ncbi:MAG: hypothetical protein HS111_26355 [Kofleriaceae bacterium]|nr:hypothetical protein [Kofleriaceae bacterium]
MEVEVGERRVRGHQLDPAVGGPRHAHAARELDPGHGQLEAVALVADPQLAGGGGVGRPVHSGQPAGQALEGHVVGAVLDGARLAPQAGDLGVGEVEPAGRRGLADGGAEAVDPDVALGAVLAHPPHPTRPAPGRGLAHNGAWVL